MEIPNHIISTINSILAPYDVNIENMLSSEHEEKYYTRKTLAEKLNISMLTIDRAISDKKLKRYKIGKKVLISECQVQNWLKKCV